MSSIIIIIIVVVIVIVIVIIIIIIIVFVVDIVIVIGIVIVISKRAVCHWNADFYRDLDPDQIFRQLKTEKMRQSLAVC